MRESRKLENQFLYAIDDRRCFVFFFHRGLRVNACHLRVTPPLSKGHLPLSKGHLPLSKGHLDYQRVTYPLSRHFIINATPCHLRVTRAQNPAISQHLLNRSADVFYYAKPSQGFE